MHKALWAAQIVLAALFIMGAVMKFLPIVTASGMMPWMGEVPSLVVRLLGIIDLLAALGLVLPGLFHLGLRLTCLTALCMIALMLSAIIFHVVRGEVSSIGINVFCMLLAGFVAWGRFDKPKTMQ